MLCFIYFAIFAWVASFSAAVAISKGSKRRCIVDRLIAGAQRAANVLSTFGDTSSHRLVQPRFFCIDPTVRVIQNLGPTGLHGENRRVGAARKLDAAFVQTAVEAALVSRRLVVNVMTLL